MKNVVEQQCLVRAVEDNGSNLTLSVEPIKKRCKGCDGKCAKMLKPAELINVKTQDKSIKLDDTVMLYMQKTDLRNLVFLILGIPVFALLFIVIIGTYLKFAEWQIILSIFISLVFIFLIQIKYLNLSQQIEVKKVEL